jgi:hypothetical protein
MSHEVERSTLLSPDFRSVSEMHGQIIGRKLIDLLALVMGFLDSSYISSEIFYLNSGPPLL